MSKKEVIDNICEKIEKYLLEEADKNGVSLEEIKEELADGLIDIFGD